MLKQLHLLCVLLSGAGFILRGGLMVFAPTTLQHPLARILPHLIDTILLGSAIGMVSLIGWQVLTQSWLLGKLVLLLLYIVLGSVALKRGRTLKLRIFAFALALLVFAQIVATGWLRDPGGLLTLIVR